MASKAGPFTFAELQTVTSLGRGEIRECVNRGIISAPAGVGQGNHRAYSKWNLVEGVIAAALLRHIRAGSVADLMTRLRLLLMARRIDRETYCAAPDRFDFYDFEVHFPPRAKPDDKADPGLGEDMGKDAFLNAPPSKVPRILRGSISIFSSSAPPMYGMTLSMMSIEGTPGYPAPERA